MKFCMNFKVIGHRSRSLGFLYSFCLRDSLKRRFYFLKTICYSLADSCYELVLIVDNSIVV